MVKEHQITVNGELRTVSAGSTLYDVVCALGLVPDRVAVEHNRAIVKRDLWITTPVDAGAEIEIVQFVGGG